MPNPKTWTLTIHLDDKEPAEVVITAREARRRFYMYSLPNEKFPKEGFEVAYIKEVYMPKE